MTMKQRTLRKVSPKFLAYFGLLDVFHGADATTLDTWVLDQLRTLFQNATTDATLNSHLHEDKVIFFLHLLGLDTTGHAYRPFSRVRRTEILYASLITFATTGIHAEYPSR